VVVGVDPHLHHRAELGDGGDRRLEAILGGEDVPGAQCAHAVVSLGVVGAKHQLGELGGHLAALGQRVVEREHV
jgi:hypothetical protein